MKRQIKFRAWDSIRMTTSGIMFNCSTGELCTPDGANMKLMQFTGLQDKNGKDIYEGDILRFLDGKNTSSECGFDWEEDYSIGEVYWCSERKGWQVSNQVMTDDDSVWEDIVIIGNIYENSELLNSQK